MIMNVDVNKIIPHQNNPRKNLGDLTELADSIKANGILQNLTIVPADVDLYKKKIAGKKAYQGEYIAIIGHRRHAAAKLAGLDKIPCIIVPDMDEKTQIATMLLENIQRNDLTLCEQAQGFQMMLDFGDSVDEIAKKTGFSKSTIRSRVKLLVLDKDKFQESLARGATLKEYAELDAIKDVELKNKVLEKIGTPNFKYNLKHALDSEKHQDAVASFIEELKEFAAQTEVKEGFRSIKYLSPYQKLEFPKPQDADTVKYYFSVSQYGINIFREITAEDEAADLEREKNQQEHRERHARFDEISTRALNLRIDFIKNFNSAKKYANNIMVFASQSMFLNSWNNFGKENLLEMLDIELGLKKDDPNAENNKLMFEALTKRTALSPEKVLLVTAYCNFDDSRGFYNKEFVKNERLIYLYEFLQSIGYEMSDEEKALCNGTHELFGNVQVEDEEIPEAA